MLLGGLWHGASWNFLAWGGYHGLLLAFERWRGKQSWYEFLPQPLQIGTTFFLILLSWVLFRAPDLPSAFHYYSAMFSVGEFSAASALLGASLYTPYKLLLLAIAGCLVFQRLQAHDWALKPQTWGRVALLVPLFVISLVVMFGQSFNPFLYFQF